MVNSARHWDPRKAYRRVPETRVMNKLLRGPLTKSALGMLRASPMATAVSELHRTRAARAREEREEQAAVVAAAAKEAQSRPMSTALVPVSGVGSIDDTGGDAVTGWADTASLPKTSASSSLSAAANGGSGGAGSGYSGLIGEPASSPPREYEELQAQQVQERDSLSPKLPAGSAIFVPALLAAEDAAAAAAATARSPSISHSLTLVDKQSAVALAAAGAVAAAGGLCGSVLSPSLGTTDLSFTVGLLHSKSPRVRAENARRPIRRDWRPAATDVCATDRTALLRDAGRSSVAGEGKPVSHRPRLPTPPPPDDRPSYTARSDIVEHFLLNLPALGADASEPPVVASPAAGSGNRMTRPRKSTLKDYATVAQAKRAALEAKGESE